MRQAIFYITVALFAFGIGSFIVFGFYRKTIEQSVVVQKAKLTSDDKAVDDEIKYGCKNKELTSFWEKINKESFLKAVKVQMREFYSRSKPDITQIQWERLVENFDCEYFHKLEKKDLNNDGLDEIFVRGKYSSNRGDLDLFVFREIDGKLKLILFTFTGGEIKIKNKRNNEFSNITFKSEYFSHGGRRIESYRFDRENYKSAQCFAEYKWETDVAGKIINHKKPVITPCD